MTKQVYFYDLQTGIFTGQILSGPASWVDANTPAGFGGWQNVSDYLSQKVALENGTLVDYQPPKPDDTDLLTFAWDAGLKRWVGTSTARALKDQKKAHITVLRESKNNEPISYDNALFDADELGQRNVQAWTNTIAAGTNPPAGFVWRDFDNIDHPADAAFVVGLNNAIVERGTALYQLSWQKKSEVEALMSIDDVIEYDATAGW